MQIARENSGLSSSSKTKAIAGLVVDEFLLSNSITDASVSVDELQSSEDMLSELCKQILLTAMDKSDKQRIMVAGLLSSLCVRGALQTSNVEAGLELFLKRLQDLMLDVPKANDYAVDLIAHLVEDKTVPETFLDSVPSLAGPEIGVQILEGVKGQLKLPLQVTVLKGQAKSVFAEYFVAGDLDEALRRLEELHAGRAGHVVVKALIVSAAERKSRECEMASVLLSAMTKVYGSEHLFEGFIRLLRSVDDLALDTPAMASILTNFIARAIVDDVLPPCFFSLVPGKLVTTGRGKEIQCGVRALLELQGSSRIMNVWGSGAKQTMEELRESVRMLVDEYFVSGDVGEAVGCVRELGAPHYGHHIIKSLIYKAVESGEEQVRKSIVLVKALLAGDVLDHLQVHKGISRALLGLPDLALDVPSARPRLDSLVALAVQEGLLPDTFRSHLEALAQS
uniref:MI domain-containing protein n=1 Tax=Cryptomonas curvata TaxID=233186 RepID=A0A7S0ME80_9CRYP|mmetsp:Transcript_37062/g.77467  ORF Transcript_37062/g.77467 Transcript_37062/m.77467 type:complete len:452 (+) Transcript_37062:162-1517(+)